MRINLNNTANLFIQDHILFDKKINFIFGKNGCGKSTITRLIKEQHSTNFPTSTVHIFQGFESVIGEGNKLKTIALGEENLEINSQIQEKNNQIKQIEESIIQINKSISETEIESGSLGEQSKQARSELNKEEKKQEEFFKNSAKKIKEYEPRICRTSYNLNDFESDIPNAKLLNEEEINNLLGILRSEVKEATLLELIKINLINELDEVNKILRETVEEKVHLERLDNNSQKKKFAEEGLHLHKSGDLCAFCNGTISESTILELRRYFSADEVNELRDKINNRLEILNEFIIKLNNINISTDEFYVNYHSEITKIEIDFYQLKNNYISFLEKISSALKGKLGSLFEVMEPINPSPSQNYNDIDKLVEKFNTIVQENNNDDLVKKQEDAKKSIKLHLVKCCLDDFKYELHCNKIENLQKNFDAIEVKIRAEKEKVGNYEKNIRDIRCEVKALLESTRNENVLVERINKKLKLYASFKLIHQDGSNDYKVRCLRTSNIRGVNELSTGEKNIIAFLYFIERISEEQNSNRYIVFDDPMNSNDDTVQYLIIEELQGLMKNISNNDRLIILTHNIHFYLNIKYGCKYKENNFYRLTKINNNAHIQKLDGEKDDFKTSYEALWKELKVIVDNNSIDASMLLNPIRRIIETYTKFNGISQNDFFKNQNGARKLFNVNSHSIDDLEAELNGINKQDIIVLLKECFEKNDALEHYNKFFGE